MNKYKELELNLEKDSHEKISSIIIELIISSYEFKDDIINYREVCEGLGSLILFLVHNDRFVFGIKDKKNEETKNNHEHMN